MPRTGRRRSLTTAAALLAVLAAPAAAQAATYTVKAGDGPCGAADLACGSLADAAAAAAVGDVFNVSPGTYGSATFTVGGITIAGSGLDATVDGSLTFSGATGGPAKLQKMSVTLPTGSGPAVSVTGAAGLEVSDAIILGTAGDGLQFHEGTANKVVRSLVVTGGTQTAAVRVLSADSSAAAKALTMDSTLVTGGAAGLSVDTGNGGALVSAPGGVTVTLHHVTAAGSTNGLVLDASKANPLTGGPFGNITASVLDSIIQNGTKKAVYAGVPILAPANTVTDTYARTLTSFDSNAVFTDPARRRYKLKAGSPAINAGGFTPGESTTDFDGDDRSAAPTDQGFDEYVVPPPPPPPPGGPGPGGTGGGGDGVAPKVVITKPKLNEKIRLTTKTTKTTTVTKKGKKVKVKKTTTKKNKISFAGTATDPSGIGAVAITVQKLATGTDEVPATVAPTAKCKWLNATKGIVSKACTKPILLLAKTAADGSWTFNVRSSLRLGAGTYRIIAVGVDKSGARGNSASAGEAIHRFTLLK
jgi:hypothetical protein